MTSGIYRLTFKTGDTYVGKSVDVVQRWKQHFDKLSKGTAAKNMLTAYYASNSRYPKTELLLECHPDVLDEYENYFINSLKPVLNTQRPVPRPQIEQDILVRHANSGRAVHSTPAIISSMEIEYEQKLTALEKYDTLKHEFGILETEYEKLVGSWDNRALRDARTHGKFRQVETELHSAKTQLTDLTAECENLRQFRVRVEGLGWFGRLFKLW